MDGQCSVCGTSKIIVAEGYDANAEGTENAIHWQCVKNGDTDTYTLEISGSGVMKDYTYNTMPWYEYRSNVTAITVGAGITRIGNYAFYFCQNTTSVTIDEGVESIGQRAFQNVGYHTQIDELVVPASVKSIEEKSFYWMNARKLIFAAGSQLESIGSTIFDIADACYFINFTGAQKPTIADDAFSKMYVNIVCPESWGDIEAGYGAYTATWLKGGQLADEVTPLTLETPVADVTFPAKQAKWFSFTPEESGLYILSALNRTEDNLRLYVFDSSDLSMHLVERDNMLPCQLEASKTYYYKICSYFGSTASLLLEAAKTSGTFGNDDALTWDFTDGILTIGGTGALTEQIDGNAPYSIYKDEVTQVVINEGVTALCEFAFYQANNISTITLPATCTNLGQDAFFDCSVSKLYVGATELTNLPNGIDVANIFSSPKDDKDIYFLSQTAYNQAVNALKEVNEEAEEMGEEEVTWGTLHAPVSVSVKIGGTTTPLISAYADTSYTFSATSIAEKGIDPCAYTWKNADVDVAYGTTFENVRESIVLVGTPGENHDFSKKTLTAESVEDGLYAYVCEREGCGGHSDARVVKDFNGEGNHLALTKDGSTYSAASVTIEDGNAFQTPVTFTTSNVSMERTFTQSTSDAVVPATIMLPFSIEASALATEDGDVVTGTKFYGFTSLTQNAETGKWEANMDRVKGTVEAYTPYMIVLTEGTSIDFGSNEVTFAATPAENNNTTQGEWTFVGTSERKVWTDDDYVNGEVYYGYAASGQSTAEAGKFVKVGTDASIKPLRSYIMKTPVAAGPKNAPTRATDVQLPNTIAVHLNELFATGIGELNIETGEFTFDGWYDLNGNRISEPVKNGISIKNNKKVIIK